MSPINSLDGCINDAKALQQFFESRGYETVLRTDETKKGPVSFLSCCVVPTSVQDMIYTTKLGMLSDMKRLVKDAKGPIVMTFSGHGSQVKDTNRDEADQLDEVIIPIDEPVAGSITDDAMRQIFEGCEYPVFCIFDSCHSGSVLDLPFSYDPKTGNVASGTELTCKIVCISGCRDNETSSDTENVEGINGYCGALTACFLASVKSLPNGFTAKQLADAIAAKLKKNAFSQSCILSYSQSALLDQPVTF